MAGTYMVSAIVSMTDSINLRLFAFTT